MRKLLILIIFLVFVSFSFFLSKPPTTENNLVIKRDVPDVRKEIILSAWLPWWKEKSAMESIIKSEGKIKQILPVWYQIDKDGKLFETRSTNRQEIINLAAEKSIEVLPTISNATTGGFDPERISLILSSERLMRDLSDNLIVIAGQQNYSGWDLDWEEIKETDRDKYSYFIEFLQSEFSQNNLLLSVTVHAQKGHDSDWVGTKGQNIKTIGKHADYVRVMAYDFHYATSPPGSVTPITDLVEVIEYAASIIPMEKLVLGLPTYGYDWGKDVGYPLQHDQVIERLQQFGATSTRDKDSFSVIGTYHSDGTDHVIWYEDSESLEKKISVASSYGIYQFCLWHIGGEDLKIWDLQLY